MDVEDDSPPWPTFSFAHQFPVLNDRSFFSPHCCASGYCPATAMNVVALAWKRRSPSPIAENV